MMFVNRCGHLFCLKCLSRLVSEKKNCSNCDSEFSDKLKKKIIENGANISMVRIKIICQVCKRNETSIYLPESCGHLCISCVKERFRDFLYECPICFINLIRGQKLYPYSEIKAVCDSCRAEKSYLLENYEKFVCGHTLCGSCIEDSIRKRKCNACCRPLNQYQLLEYIKAISEQCSDCKKIAAIRFTHQNLCCKQYICSNCKPRHIFKKKVKKK